MVVLAPYLAIVPLVTVALILVGCVIVIVAERKTPLESVIVNVCVPATFANLPVPI